MKRFKSKKFKNIKLLKISILIFIVIFCCFKTYKFLINNSLKDKFNNEKFLNYLLYNTINNHLENNELLTILKTFNLSNPAYLINLNVNKSSVSAFEDVSEPSDLTIPHLTDPFDSIVNEPLVYIYNTHQKEAYSSDNLLEYNIKPTVLLASYILKEKLNDLGIKTIVEEQDITELLRVNNWQYRYSYEASKLFINEIKEKEPTIKYFIDLHRDSSKRTKTITEIDKKIYARILFVVGLEHPNYESNLLITTKLNNLIKEKYPTLSRGIYKKSGAGVNGIYNQDLSPNAVLLEMGGQYNTIEEVNNTINIIAPIIADYLKEAENIAN